MSQYILCREVPLH